LTIRLISSKLDPASTFRSEKQEELTMHRHSTVIALGPVLLASYVLAAVPNNAAVKSNAAKEIESRPNALVLAQAGEARLEAQEQALLNQIQADTAKLKADEAAERTQNRPVNPQIRFIRASLIRLGEAAGELRHTTPHYRGHRADALRAMAEAHNQLIACYRIDSQR